MNLLATAQYPAVSPLFAPLENHLAVSAVLSGAFPGVVWADHPDSPRSALLCAGWRFHLAGDPDNPPFIAGLRQLFLEEIYPQGAAQGRVGVSVFYTSPAWETAVLQVLEGKRSVSAPREYYEFTRGMPLPDWRASLPAGVSVEPVDAALLEQTGLDHLEDLRCEMASECPSTDYFLEHRFGLALVVEGGLAGWCLSEYNLGQACEVGIEIVEGYRRKGLGALLAGAFLENALARGVDRIGWHCFTRNLPSSATARKAGYRKVEDLNIYFAFTEN